MSVYRTAALSVIPKTPKNVYKYTVINSVICPICNLPCNGYYNKYAYQIPYGKYVHCHPLKRIVVKGHWFWKKTLPSREDPLPLLLQYVQDILDSIQRKRI